jgi:myosin heavy subunit
MDSTENSTEHATAIWRNIADRKKVTAAEMEVIIVKMADTLTAANQRIEEMVKSASAMESISSLLAAANKELLRKLDCERDALKTQVAELEDSNAAIRRLLFAAAEIMEDCAGQVDLIFPNDANPEMQTVLRDEYAAKLRALSESEMGRIRGPEGMIAAAATEERRKKEVAERRAVKLETSNTAMRKTLIEVRNIIDESEGVTGWHLNGDIASWGEFGYPEDIDAVLE